MADVLLIDDEPSIRLAVADALRTEGHNVVVASDGAEGLGLATGRAFDVVITDIRLPKVDGLTLFRRIKAESPETDVILITAYGTVNDAVGALKDGAADFLLKPFDTDEIVIRVARSAEKRALQRALSQARDALSTRDGLDAIIGKAPPMLRLKERIETMAASEAPILITGESGTGKEMVARSLHRLSPRRDQPFVAVNCAAFPETLLEAELFGHERGAFTGAFKRREGRFKSAHGGSLFLDEIAEIPPTSQAKLLRVLQEGIIEPLGSDTPVKVDVRIISATHQNLKERIGTRQFREDLYYRLKVLDIQIPALRDRKSDLPLLVEHFLRMSAKTPELPVLAPRAWSALSEYAFPGNIRELQHAIERACVLSRGREIDLDDLPEEIGGARASAGPASVQAGDGLRPLSVAMKEFEREYLLRALSLAEGRKARAAEMLGISRKNLWEKLRGHGISTEEAEEER